MPLAEDMPPAIQGAWRGSPRAELTPVPCSVLFLPENILIQDSMIITMDKEQRIFEKGSVIIQDDKILDIGNWDLFRLISAVRSI